MALRQPHVTSTAAQRTPAEIARETLKVLAARRMAPSPDNYTRVYEEIAGVPGQYSGSAVDALIAALRDAARSAPAMREPVQRMQRALAEHNWKACAAELVTVGSNAAGGSGAQWSDALRELARQCLTRHIGISAERKRESLERLLIHFGQSPELPDKLLALARAWSEAREAQTGIATAESEPSAASEPGRDARGGAAGPDGDDGPAPVTVALRALVVRLLRDEIAPRMPHGTPLAARAEELARTAERATTPADCEALSAALRDFALETETIRQRDGRLVEDLMGLVRLLIDNVGGLVDDDDWVTGQVEVMRQVLREPLTPRVLDEAESRFREILFRQCSLKENLIEAKRTIKEMVAVFIERLGELATSTGDYHDRLGRYNEQIQHTQDIAALRGVLDSLMQDVKAMQVDAQRSRDDVSAVREQAESAQSKIRELESELQAISERVREDALTGALNRRGLDETYGKEAARAERYATDLCVAVLDIDNFKKLNDTHGHHVGDEALKHLVKVVKGLLRPTDTVGRFGGEEFVILLPETSIEGAVSVVQRLQRELTRQFFLADNEKLLITFSAGVARFRRGEPQEWAIQRADAAMYNAKRAGKNRVYAAE
jgi:diguanylate cyclase